MSPPSYLDSEAAAAPGTDSATTGQNLSKPGLLSSNTVEGDTKPAAKLDNDHEEELPHGVREGGNGASARSSAQSGQESARTLNADLQSAYQSLATSGWGQTLGGFFGTVKNQVQAQVKQVQKTEVYSSSIASVEAAVGAAVKNLNLKDLKVNDLLGGAPATSPPTGPDDPSGHLSSRASNVKDETTEMGNTERSHGPGQTEGPPRRSVDLLEETKAVFSKFATTARETLKELEEKEKAADEALIRWGQSVGSFFRDAVNMVPKQVVSPDGKVIFESQDSKGRRVFHSSRLEAQLHAIHSSDRSFLADPDSAEYGAWADRFDAATRTGEIAADLERFPELRKAMEACVPEKVDYPTFWTRYYYLRTVLEEGEARRKELLRGAASKGDEDDDVVGWGSDSEADGEEEPRPVARAGDRAGGDSDAGSGESDEDDEDDDTDDDDEDDDEYGSDDSENDDDDDEDSETTPGSHGGLSREPSAATLKPTSGPTPSSAKTATTKSGPGANPALGPAETAVPRRRSNDRASEASYDLVSSAAGSTPVVSDASGCVSRTASAAPSAKAGAEDGESESEDDWE